MAKFMVIKTFYPLFNKEIASADCRMARNKPENTSVRLSQCEGNLWDIPVYHRIITFFKGLFEW